MMIFKVPEDYKGSFVLKTVDRALWAGVRISIVPPDLYSSDVKAAIKNKVLIPIKSEEYDKISDLSYDVMLVNRTDRRLVLGSVVLKPWASQVVSKHICSTPEVIGAESNGFIHIVTDEKTYDNQDAVFENIPEEKKKIVEDNSKKEKELSTTAKVWDFQKQSIKDAELVPKVGEMVRIDEEEESDDIDFVDSENKNTSKKKKSAKKKKETSKNKTKKKKVNKKKEETATKKRKTNIKPVGKKREEIKDVVVPIDSRGNIISEKPSDVLNAMIGDLVEDVDFVDKEQESQKKNERDLDGSLDDLDW
jgi:hypothetical protein